MLHGKGEPLSKMAKLPEMKEKKIKIGACMKTSIISYR